MQNKKMGRRREPLEPTDETNLIEGRHAVTEALRAGRRLAQELWNENIRETRLLACLLMPPQEFAADLADIWGDEIPTAEVAQIMATHLLPKAPGACGLAFEWIASDNEMKQLCGFLCVARLLQQDAPIEERSLEELENQAHALSDSASPSLKKAIAAALN